MTEKNKIVIGLNLEVIAKKLLKTVFLKLL